MKGAGAVAEAGTGAGTGARPDDFQSIETAAHHIGASAVGSWVGALATAGMAGVAAMDSEGKINLKGLRPI